MNWYVIECYPGQDFDVCRKLAQADYNIWRPMKKITTTLREGPMRGRRCRSVPRFGRYLFLDCELTPGRRFAISTETGVRGFLKRAGVDEPAIVPDEWMNFLMFGKAIEDRRGIVFAPGTRVTVNAGPLRGREGVVRSVDDGTAKVILDAFGCLAVESSYLDPLVLCRAMSERRPTGRETRSERDGTPAPMRTKAGDASPGAMPQASEGQA
ncbi:MULTISPECIES: transcription termination/antitermination protein NusG [Methylosinus]|nr:MULTISPECIES: transcription termination/antitermination NusG family protein [Methylosinus]OBS51146.1 hypothetical protein A8B73_17650 [Methylosinus sp. 3S-1]